MLWNRKGEEAQLQPCDLKPAPEPERRLLPRGALTDADHATAFIGWCQDNWIIGDVKARDIERKHYPEFCRAMGWEPHSWDRVSPHAKRMLGCSKNTTRYREGRYWLCYPIPPAERPEFTPARLHGFPRATDAAASGKGRVTPDSSADDAAA